MDQRETVKLQNPNVPSQEISRLLGTLWNTLPASDREFYESQYREDNEVYNKKLAEYKAGNALKAEEHHSNYDHDDGLGESPESDEESDDQDGHGSHPFHSGHPHKSKSKSHKSSYNNHSPGGHQGSSSEVNLLKKKKKSHHSSSHFH
ncbi:hypothetical protein CONCODRAFT_79964 [Conidiobolus coronatus NRRL 28638]|uniref:HMG box domain-containing protein n=1 Tax=Conidiobolus coronatus (strain ATCC 28846 / CBS 209.66 / NRRL 28638) TaxID=796925 RepID=A0A137NYI7_CONC2|nr:hypothetical protein CONCODRAFT_79964 [Conidiobolus coronatus NRRL 28638]|eukprot:KXN67930.1 hypothetical protein CONCODRAFT_79964 [Conidiobolus coronatus NRRL 28638]